MNKNDGNPFKIRHHASIIGAYEVYDTRTGEAHVTTTLHFRAQDRALSLWETELASRRDPKLSRTLKYLAYSKCYIGNTRDLRGLASDGYQLKYELGGTYYPVAYAPRFKTDPKPWVQVGGLESRLSSGEICAY